MLLIRSICAKYTRTDTHANMESVKLRFPLKNGKYFRRIFVGLLRLVRSFDTQSHSGLFKELNEEIFF